MCLQVHVPLATCTVVLRSTCVGSIDGYICFKYSCTCTWKYFPGLGVPDYLQVLELFRSTIIHLVASLF